MYIEDKMYRGDFEVNLKHYFIKMKLLEKLDNGMKIKNTLLYYFTVQNCAFWYYKY